MLTSVGLKKDLIEAVADRPFCLLDGEEHRFPRDNCLDCPAFRFCNENWGAYLVAISKLERLRLGWK